MKTANPIKFVDAPFTQVLALTALTQKFKAENCFRPSSRQHPSTKQTSSQPLSAQNTAPSVPLGENFGIPIGKNALGTELYVTAREGNKVTVAFVRSATVQSLWTYEIDRMGGLIRVLSVYHQIRPGKFEQGRGETLWFSPNPSGSLQAYRYVTDSL